MKQLRTPGYLLSILLLMATGSCCLKSEVQEQGISEIEFRNIPPEDLDTIRIDWFDRSMGFGFPIDTMRVITPQFTRGTYEVISLPRPLSPGCDYRIRLLSSGQVFMLTDFQMTEQPCNTVSACGCKKKVLTGYKVNGQQEELTYVRISN